MKLDNNDPFSYKEAPFLKLTHNNYVVAVKDEDFPERNILPLFYYDNGIIRSIDEWDMGKIVVIPHKTIQDKSLSRFNLQQIIKISYGTISGNTRYYEGGALPKCSTIDSYIYPIEANQIIEFFEGVINVEDSLFTPQMEFFQLIKEFYVETENCFFIIFQEKLLGPFKAVKVNDNSFKIAKSTFKTFGEYEFNENSYLELEANDLIRKLYIEVNDLSLVFKEEYDFTSDDELLTEFQTELINYPNYFNENNLENVLSILRKTTQVEKIESKIRDNFRLRKILEKGGKVLDSDIDLLKNIPEIKEIKENKQKLEEEFFVLKQDIEKIETRRNKLANEISELEQTKNEELEKRKAELDSDIINLEARKENLEKEVEERKLKLEESNREIKSENDKLRIIQDDLKAGVQKLKSEFTSEQKNSQEKLAELVKGKTHFDFISGRDLSEQENEIFVAQDFKIIDQFEKYQYREFRNDVVNILKQNNRNFDNHFVDNLLISIFQNTLTVFAGVPGTGKTTLARILANILTPKEKIREVSVNRGWTSQKDFIGFVNPLTKRFHSSSTDIYSLTKQMNEEAKDEGIYLKTPMSFIILDEANLSPLEHYWSSFYNLTDSRGMLEVKLGHNEAIKFPNNLRFIGTINYDHTTEELSPRVLDRINIIQLNKAEDISFNNISNAKIKNIQLSFQRCIEFFELSDSIEFEIDPKIEKGYKDIKNEFKNLKIYISPRVEIAIRRYISLSSKHMSDVNKPLDYCVAQRLLPLINLQGSENKLKLESLKDQLKNNKCDISTRILEDIINIGSEEGIYKENYNYFLTLSNV